MKVPIFLKYSAEVYSEPTRTSKMELLAKNSWKPLPVNYFCKNLHLRCFTAF